MFDRKLALIAGTDIPIVELSLTLHQPKIKEIALIGDSSFFLGIQCLNVSTEAFIKDKTLLEKTNNFQIFMMIMKDKESIEKKDAVLKVLSLIFPGYKISILPRSIMFSKENETIIMDELNFNILQEILKDVFCLRGVGNQGFNPGDAKAKEIADKLMKARQRVAAQKQGGEGSLFVMYTSILTVGLNSMSLEDCLNLTMYQMMDLIERYYAWLSWDMDIKSRLAGGKPDSRPENWMRNIH